MGRKQRFTFHLRENGTDNLEDEGHETLASAMNHAVTLAFKVGAGKSNEEMRGLFICVLDENGHEVFRTPVANAG